MSRALARPIAMFVDQSDAEATGAAIDAGVSAYVVDGLSKQRIKPVIDLAVRRFQAFSRLQRELDEAKNALAERAVIDKRSEEHTSELQSLMRNSYAVFCLKKKKKHTNTM